MVDLDNLGRTPAVYALAQSDNTLALAASGGALAATCHSAAGRRDHGRLAA
jgi:hypothetical protein